MANLSEKENNRWPLKKAIIRVFAYLFCVFLIWYGYDAFTSYPTTPKDKLRGIGMIVAAFVYLFTDIRILKKNNHPNH